MAKDPAFLFYSADFLIGTARFTSAETGDYIRLICHLHQGGHMALQDMKSIAPNLSQKVLSKFTVDENGFYFQERLEAEVLKRKMFTESRLKNLAKHKGNHMNAHMGSHMENDNDNGTSININEEEKKNQLEKFAQFWAAYPTRNGKRVGKAETFRVFLKLKPDEADMVLVAVTNYAQSQAATSGYAKDPIRFLRNDFWKDWMDGPGEKPKTKTATDKVLERFAEEKTKGLR